MKTQIQRQTVDKNNYFSDVDVPTLIFAYLFNRGCARVDLLALDNRFFDGAVTHLSSDVDFTMFFEIELDEYRGRLSQIGEIILFQETTYFTTYEDLNEAIEYINSIIILNKLIE